MRSVAAFSFLLLMLVGILASCSNQQSHDRSADALLENLPDLVADMDEGNVNVGKARSIIDSLLSRSKDGREYFLEYAPPFVYFRSGNFLNADETNAVAAYCPDDSTYSIELYTLKNKEWVINDRLGGLEQQLIFFVTQFGDYNFDKQGDIYIQRVVSNGIALSRGYLLLVDPKAKRLEYHPEANDLANMQPDPSTRTIISEEFIPCSNGMKGVCKLANKWIDDKLVTVKQRCPCEEERW